MRALESSDTLGIFRAVLDQSPTRRWRLLSAAVLATSLLGLPTGCGSTGPYTWYRDVPLSEWGPPSGEYVIAVGDSLSIRVYDQEGLSTQVKVRTDGRIALPFAGEMVVAGMHPSDVARELERRLKEFIVSPRVTINVEQWQPISVTILGEVGRVGVLTLEPSSGLIQALAQAGGFSQFADKSKIFVLRRFPTYRRIRFTYDALVRNENQAAAFMLRAGDVIVVE